MITEVEFPLRNKLSSEERSAKHICFHVCHWILLLYFSNRRALITRRNGRASLNANWVNWLTFCETFWNYSFLCGGCGGCGVEIISHYLVLNRIRNEIKNPHSESEEFYHHFFFFQRCTDWTFTRPTLKSFQLFSFLRQIPLIVQFLLLRF